MAKATRTTELAGIIAAETRDADSVRHEQPHLLLAHPRICSPYGRLTDP